MADLPVEWVDGDPFWPRVHRLMRLVMLGVALVLMITLLQDFGILNLLPYSTYGGTGSAIELAWIGIILLGAFMPFRLPVAGPIGITRAGLLVRGNLRQVSIPRSRIYWVGSGRMMIRGWGGGEVILTPLQFERISSSVLHPKASLRALNLTSRVLPAPRRNTELGQFRQRTVSPHVHWHCIAGGRVQGVNYRARVAEAAHRHSVVGTVANRPDGTVFIDVQGPLDAVEAFLRDVSGPRGVSHAYAVERVAEVAVSPDLVGFEIVRV